jgi:hypothetical protein
LPPGRAGGLDEAFGNPIIRSGLADEQMFGDALVRLRLLAEQPCGATVVPCALSG